MADASVPNPTSPKVKWGAIAAAAVTALIFIIGAVVDAIVDNPDGLGFTLPTWVLFLLPVVAQAVVAYLKNDPLRDAGRAHIAHSPAFPDGTGKHRL